MMKILSIFLVMSAFASAQQQYEFDYLIEYDYSYLDKSSKFYLLTNSKNNQYYVYLSPADGGNLKLSFRDEKGRRAFSLIPRKQFFEAESIVIKMNEPDFDNRHKNSIERYVFYLKPDTLIAGITYKQYGMKYRRESESRKYDKGSGTYIIENGTEFHKPLMLFSAPFDTSVTSEIFPDGIAKEIFDTTRRSGKKKMSYKLANFKEVRKVIKVQSAAAP